MLLEKITLQNFGIYKDENVFELTSTKEKPIILCGGKNGGGKTEAAQHFSDIYDALSLWTKIIR